MTPSDHSNGSNASKKPKNKNRGNERESEKELEEDANNPHGTPTHSPVIEDGKTIGQALHNQTKTNNRKRKRNTKKRTRKVPKVSDEVRQNPKPRFRRQRAISSSQNSSSSEVEQESPDVEDESPPRPQPFLSKEAMESIIKNVTSNVLLAGREPFLQQRSFDVEAEHSRRPPRREPYPRASDPPQSSFHCQGQYHQCASQATPITICGTLVPENLREKIINGRYFDLKALHPTGLKKKGKKTIEIDDSDDECKIKINKEQDEGEGRKELTEFEWLECFLDYTAIYTKEYPSATEGILSYTKFIINLMQKGKDWRTYDIHFRRARESKTYLWTDILMDSRFDITDKAEGKIRQTSRQQFFPAPYQRSKIAFGYCYSHHSKNSRCNRRFCQYDHRCQLCNGNHQLYRHRDYNQKNYPEPRNQAPSFQNRRYSPKRRSPRRSPDPNQGGKTSNNARRV